MKTPTNSLSTGSTLLNLAWSDNPFGGFVGGKYYFNVGDSQSGKTFLAITNFAEAVISEQFRDHRLIYDNIEDGMLMDLDRLFSETVADRVEPPRRNGTVPVFSATIEDFYYNLDDALKDGRPFIYVLDSMDALDSEAADKKFDLNKKVYRKRQAKAEGATPDDGEKEVKVAGSFGDGKAKKNSEFLRKACKELKKTNSILIVLAQTRDALNSQIPGMKTRAGGRALRFYATVETWSSVIGPIKKNVNDKERKIGNRVRLDVKKNRITGMLHTVEIDIYPSIGIDDVGTCVDYLVEEGWWPCPKQTIEARGLGLSGTREKIIRLVEKKNLEDKLREECGKCWTDITVKSAVPRKNRYAVADAPADDGEEAE